jgi:hypothetical protein
MQRFPWLTFDRFAKIDWDREITWLQQVVLAGSAALAVAIGGDVLAVHLARSLFHVHGTYQPFTISRYGLFTFVGVAGAVAAWPIVNWISTRPRELYGILAVAVTLVLLLPDARLFQSTTDHSLKYGAVGTLVVMHLWIAVVTYAFMVLGAREPRADDLADRPGSAALRS